MSDTRSELAGGRRERPRRSGRTVGRAVVVAATMAALALAGLGSSASGSVNRTTREVMATLDFTHLDGAARFCDGQDGGYDEQKGTASGTSSGDPRLTGRFELEFRSLDRVNDHGHLGTVEGHFRVFDHDTGRRKVEAQFHAAQHYGTEVGILVGKAWDRTGVATLMAGIRIDFVDFNNQFDVIGQIGGAVDLGVLPAVLQSGGGCSGPWQPYSFSLPLPF